MANASGGAGRIAELDGLRAVAILAVFAHHAYSAPLAWAGVDIFFALSGFLITGILLERKERGRKFLADFYWRRAKRILPPYALLLVVATVLFGAAWMHRWYFYTFFGTNIAEAIERGQRSLQPLWSLAVEEQFYLLWPWVVLLLPERALRWLCVLALVLAPALRAVATPWFGNHFPIYYLTPFRADLLCAGGLVAIAWRHSADSVRAAGKWAWIAVIATLAVFAWLDRYPDWHTSSNSVRANTFVYSLTLVLAVGLLLSALRGRGMFCAVLRNPVLRYLGVISYSMYLIHVACIEVAKRWSGNRNIVAAIALAMTVVYATVSWFVMERPILRWQRRHPEPIAGRAGAH